MDWALLRLSKVRRHGASVVSRPAGRSVGRSAVRNIWPSRRVSWAPGSVWCAFFHRRLLGSGAARWLLTVFPLASSSPLPLRSFLFLPAIRLAPLSLSSDSQRSLAYFCFVDRRKLRTNTHSSTPLLLIDHCKCYAIAHLSLVLMNLIFDTYHRYLLESVVCICCARQPTSKVARARAVAKFVD